MNDCIVWFFRAFVLLCRHSEINVSTPLASSDGFIKVLFVSGMRPVTRVRGAHVYRVTLAFSQPRQTLMLVFCIRRRIIQATGNES